MSLFKSTIKLGDIVRDTISGFQGVAIADHKWLHGCRRITVQPQELHDGKPIEAQTFDEPQLEKVGKERYASSSNTGGPRDESKAQRSTPTRR